MSRRGRPPKKDSARKSVPLGARVAQGLHDKLAAACTEAGRTMSQEIEARLRLSFEEHERALEAFGGPTTYWFLRCLARGIRRIETAVGTMGPAQSGTGRRWWEDQAAFEACAAFIAEAVQRMRPAGRRASARVREEASIDGKALAIDMMMTLKAVLESSEGDAELFAAAAPVAPKMHFQTPREVVEDMYDQGLIESRAKVRELLKRNPPRTKAKRPAARKAKAV